MAIKKPTFGKFRDTVNKASAKADKASKAAAEVDEDEDDADDESEDEDEDSDDEDSDDDDSDDEDSDDDDSDDEDEAPKAKPGKKTSKVAPKAVSKSNASYDEEDVTLGLALLAAVRAASK